MGKVYYNQGDPRWGSHPYTSSNHPTATVKSSGCGPTCGAMIVSSCREQIYPDRMCDISKENGYRYPEGTSDGFFDYVSSRWNIEMKRVYSSYEAHQACKEGYFVVIACGSGLWTSGGHYILAVGANDTDIEIYDPYLYNGKFDRDGRSGKVRLNGNSAWVEINTFKTYSNAQRFFAFKVDNNDESVEPTPAQDVQVAWVNTSSLNLNVRNSPNGNVIGSLPKGTQVMVYETLDGWAKIGDNKWVSNNYLSYSQPQSIPNTVGQTKKFKSFTYLWSNSDLTGTRYDYKAGTSVVVEENVNNKVDKVRVIATGRVAYVDKSAYTENNSSSQNTGRNTVGQTKKFKGTTYMYSNSDLTGTRYDYKAGTSVKVLQNTSDSVDKVCVNVTGRVAYVNINAYR